MTVTTLSAYIQREETGIQSWNRAVSFWRTDEPSAPTKSKRLNNEEDISYSYEYSFAYWNGTCPWSISSWDVLADTEYLLGVTESAYNGTVPCRSCHIEQDAEQEVPQYNQRSCNSTITILMVLGRQVRYTIRARGMEGGTTGSQVCLQSLRLHRPLT